MIHYSDEVLIDYAWISVEKLGFKLLVMASVLAIEKRAFLGTMQDICQYLGITYNSKNRSRINKALNELSQQGFIIQVRDQLNIIIALSYNAKSNSKVINIQRAWIDIIRQYKPNKKDDCVSWETILRVFIYLLGNCGGGLTTYSEIASSLSLHQNTVKKAVKALCNIDFGNMMIERQTLVESKVSGAGSFYRCLGTQFHIMINFDGVRIEGLQLDK